jgi:hypothetical protein
VLHDVILRLEEVWDREFPAFMFPMIAGVQTVGEDDAGNEACYNVPVDPENQRGAGLPMPI